MGILVWRSRLANSRLLCLANGQLGEDSTTALEVKFKFFFNYSIYF